MSDVSKISYIKSVIDNSENLEYIEDDGSINLYDHVSGDSFYLDCSLITKTVEYVAREYWNDGMQQDIDEMEINYKENPELFDQWDIINSFLTNLKEVDCDYSYHFKYDYKRKG